jgi:hypothetical protein
MALTNADAIIDFTRLNSLIQDICVNCEAYSSSNCVESQCLTGFSKIVIKYNEMKGSLNIPGAERLIPRNDFKAYEKDLAARVIAETCKLCRECRDNHADDCVIALVRSSMEITFWGESIEYPGNILGYLSAIRIRDEEMTNHILNHYK